MIAGAQTEERPYCFDRLIANSRAAASYADAIDATKVQKGEPIECFINEAMSLHFHRSLAVVGRLGHGKKSGKTKVSAAECKNDDK